jgi:hypothetical protein
MAASTGKIAFVVMSLMVSGPTSSSRKPISEMISGLSIPSSIISRVVDKILFLSTSGRELPETLAPPNPRHVSFLSSKFKSLQAAFQAASPLPFDAVINFMILAN